MTRAKKSLGQNFLMHARIAERIAHEADLSSNAVVFEIGPGTGMLTRELLKIARKVVALEADRELVEKLALDFAEEIKMGKLELIAGDVRTFPLTQLPRGYAVVANIPYYITGEIFRLLLSAENQPSSMTLLVQKEVAERVAREKKGSILSMSVRAYGEPKYLFTVPRGAFRPAPNVDSAVLGLRGISRARFTSRAHEERFFTLLHAGFAHKRKFVTSNLAGLCTQEDLSRAGVAPQARAEDLPLTVWLALASGVI